MQKHLDHLQSIKQDLVGTILTHSFLKRCRSGDITLQELKLFMVQQSLYSGYFTRYLCAMMASLPSNDDVMALAENLFEELGLAPDSPTPHYRIYAAMLADFGLNPVAYSTNIGTRHLIEAMFEHCRDHNPARGLGAMCLGAEALVPSVYSEIITGFTHCGVDTDRLKFFTIHVECDDGHADTLNEIMARLVDRDPGQIDVIAKAGWNLVQARMDFFSAIETGGRA